MTADQRRSAKAINFGLMYGMSAFGLSKQLHIDRAEAQAYMDTYFDRYPGVRAFMDGTREQAREHRIAGVQGDTDGHRLDVAQVMVAQGLELVGGPVPEVEWTGRAAFKGVAAIGNVVQVELRESTSTLPFFRALKRACTSSGTNSTASALPKSAMATARQ
mgnify:CR=1 FL=1